MADKIKVRGRDVVSATGETMFTVKGVKGDRGLQGVPGPRGPSGFDGSGGAPGKDGRDGIDGKDGASGRDGIDGKAGLNGNPGVSGKDGVSVKQATIKADGHLYLTLSDGREIDTGRARGEDGKRGKSGGGAAYQIAYDAETRILSLEMGNGVVLPIFTEEAAGLVPPPGTATGLFLRDDGTWAAAGGGSGDVVGPASSTDNAVARFNLATGKLIQNSGVTIDDNGMLGLPAITPSAPASGLNWGAFSLSGLILPGFMQSGMVAARALPMDWRKFGWYGSNSTTYGLDGAIAMSPTGTGTSKAWAATNVYTRAISTESLVTTPATNAVAGYRSTTAIMTVGGAGSGQGGFFWKSIWGPATGVSVSTTRAFWGVRALTSGPSDVEPSGLVNMVGMGWDAADTNIQMMHNDGSGTATKIDLGASFPRPAVDRTELYSIELFSVPGTTQSVVYRVVRLSTGLVATGTITTDLPSTGTILTYNTYLSVGGTSSVIGVALERIETYLFPEIL